MEYISEVKKRNDNFKEVKRTMTKRRKSYNVVRYCDKCSRKFVGAGKVRRLGTGGRSGVHLCRQCWATEMQWRKQRNKKLSGKAKFPIRQFPKSTKRYPKR